LNAALTEASVSSTVESSLVSGAASGTELSAFDLFVAVDERAERSVVGYLLAVRGDPTHVAEVAVAPDHRREGHARALLDRLFATVVERHGEDNEDLHRVRLAVEPDNDAALELYRSAGFTVARRDPNYLDGDPALLLVKSVGCEST
jgi:ribosomal-protein-alanine N-acetyltransferase